MNEIELKYQPRQQQIDGLEFFKGCVEEKKKFILFDMPTGVGKSFLVMMIADWYKKNKNQNARFDIITNTKLLQEQYINDFEFIQNISGKNNYHCEKHNCSCEDGESINQFYESKCPACPYKRAYSNFMGSVVGLSNFHFYTSVSMYAPSFQFNRKANILIIDEAHEFEQIYCDFISCNISKRSLMNIGAWDDKYEEMIENIENLLDYAKFLNDIVSPKIDSEIAKIEKMKHAVQNDAEKIELMKKYRRLDSAQCKYSRFLSDFASNPKNWIFQKDSDSLGNYTVSVEPIWANMYLKDFWKKFEIVICLSATILEKNMFSFLMGFDESQTSFLSMQSPFKVENRMVQFKNVGKMSFKEKKDTFPKLSAAVSKIVDDHSKEKGIIHTVNYEIANHLKNTVRNKRFLIHKTEDRVAMYRKHLSSKSPSILVSPSMITGVDLKDDLSRFQIIAKVPYPNLANEKNKRRLAVNPKWYAWKTIADIIQAAGRSIRNENDYATTYILDGCFDMLLKMNRSMFPKYFLDAIIRK